MLSRSQIGAIAIMAALCASATGARAFDETKYPNWKGQWVRIGNATTDSERNPIPFDPTKPAGLGQQAPLTPEYQAIFAANLKAQQEGKPGTVPTFSCLSPGMPRVMNGYGQIEFVITPETTHVLQQHIQDNRRIFTDGRTFPEEIEPTFLGIRSANGSILTVTVNMTPSKSRPVAFVGHAPSTAVAFPSMRTTRQL